MIFKKNISITTNYYFLIQVAETGHTLDRAYLCAALADSSVTVDDNGGPGQTEHCEAMLADQCGADKKDQCVAGQIDQCGTVVVDLCGASQAYQSGSVQNEKCGASQADRWSEKWKQQIKQAVEVQVSSAFSSEISSSNSWQIQEKKKRVFLKEVFQLNLFNKFSCLENTGEEAQENDEIEFLSTNLELEEISKTCQTKKQKVGYKKRDEPFLISYRQLTEDDVGNTW